MPQTFNENLELNLLACLIQDGVLLSTVEDILEQDSFGYPAYGLIYKAILNVANSGLVADAVTVEAELDRLGYLNAISIPSVSLSERDALLYLSEMKVDSGLIESYAYGIQKFQATRQVIHLVEHIKRRLESPATSDPVNVIPFIENELGKIAVFMGIESKAVRDASTVADISLQDFKDALNNKARFIATGLAFWDDFTNGLFPGRLYMVAARSNEGKSALVQNILKILSIDKGVPVHYMTFETSAEEVHNRLVQIMTGISPLRMEKGLLYENEKEPFKKATAKIKESPHTYDDSPSVTLPILRSKIRKAVANGAKLIIIDQLEQVFVGGAGENQAEYIKINYIAYRIKAYAREMNVPIILVHQLNRSSTSGENREKDVDLGLPDLAQAGEKPCDAILMLRTTRNPKVFWSKNRQGAKGSREIKWTAESILFEDAENSSEFPPDYKQETFDEEPTN